MRVSPNTSGCYILQSQIPVEGGYSIEIEPEHAKSFSLSVDTMGVKFNYTPKDDFGGIDLVEFRNEISNGAEIIAIELVLVEIRVE